MTTPDTALSAHAETLRELQSYAKQLADKYRMYADALGETTDWEQNYIAEWDAKAAACAAGARVLNVHDELVAALKAVVAHGPCSDPDCCERARQCEAARVQAREALEKAETT